jgi:hypothetical protein
MIWLFLFVSFAQASEEKLHCLEAGQLRFLALGSTREEKSSYCFDKSRSLFLSSSCHKKKCHAKKNKGCKVPPESLRGSVGSPGFKLCQALGGEAQILEFHDGERWWSMDRCLFLSDGSYMDTGLMLKQRSECPQNKKTKKIN